MFGHSVFLWLKYRPVNTLTKCGKRRLNNWDKWSKKILLGCQLTNSHQNTRTLLTDRKFWIFFITLFPDWNHDFFVQVTERSGGTSNVSGITSTSVPDVPWKCEHGYFRICRWGLGQFHRRKRKEVLLINEQRKEEVVAFYPRTRSKRNTREICFPIHAVDSYSRWWWILNSYFKILSCCVPVIKSIALKSYLKISSYPSWPSS